MIIWNAGLPFPITFISLYMELYEIKNIDFQKQKLRSISHKYV